MRHGHFAYYSLTTLKNLLGDVGMSIAAAWEFDLYGGSVLLAAVHGDVQPDETVRGILAMERSFELSVSAHRRTTSGSRGRTR